MSETDEDNPLENFRKKPLGFVQEHAMDSLRMKLDALVDAQEARARETALAAAVNGTMPLDSDATIEQIDAHADNVCTLANRFLRWLNQSKYSETSDPQSLEDIHTKDFSLADLVAEGKQELVDDDFQKDFTRQTGEEFPSYGVTDYTCAACKQPVYKVIGERVTWKHLNPLNLNEHEVVPINEKGEWQG